MNDQRSSSYFGGDNFRIAQQMSAKWAERGADFDAAARDVQQDKQENQSEQ